MFRIWHVSVVFLIFLPFRCAYSKDAPKFDGKSIERLLHQKFSPPPPRNRGSGSHIAQRGFNAFRARLAELWNPPVDASNPQETVIKIRIQFNPDGRLSGPPQVLTSGHSKLFLAARESAIKALFRGQPFEMLKDENYAQWKDIEITFDPRSMMPSGNPELTKSASYIGPKHSLLEPRKVPQRSSSPPEGYHAERGHFRNVRDAENDSALLFLGHSNYAYICRGYTGDGFASLSNTPIGDASAIKVYISLDTGSSFNADIFTNEGNLLRLLNIVEVQFRRACKADVQSYLIAGPVPGHMAVNFSAPIGYALAWKPAGANWNISDNNIAVEVHKREKFEAEEVARTEAQARAALAAQEARQHAAQAAAALRSKFISQFGVQEWVGRNQLIANPFRFKSRVIGTFGAFVRMLSEHDGLFDERGCFPAVCLSAIIVGNVPSTQFRGQEEVALAVKVLGTRVFNNTTIADLEYVGTYQCQEDGCRDFLFK